MRLVGDDDVELAGTEGRFQTSRERLERGRYDFLPMGALRSLLDPYLAVEILHRLVYELIPMRDHEHPARPGDPREGHGLAQSRRHLHQMASAIERVDRRHALSLIIPQLDLTHIILSSGRRPRWQPR